MHPLLQVFTGVPKLPAASSRLTLSPFARRDRRFGAM